MSSLAFTNDSIGGDTSDHFQLRIQLRQQFPEMPHEEFERLLQETFEGKYVESEKLSDLEKRVIYLEHKLDELIKMIEELKKENR